MSPHEHVTCNGTSCLTSALLTEPAVRRARLNDEAVQPLLTALAQEYRTRYGADDPMASSNEMASTKVEQFDPPDGLFVVVVDEDGKTVAGGGFRRHSAHACEVKRMWTSATNGCS